MRQQLLGFWRDECGALIATDWALMATILVLGLVVGAATVRHQLADDRPVWTSSSANAE